VKKLSRTLAYVFISITIFFMILFNLIGSKVDQNGLLQEPFYLIPLSYTTFTLGIIFAIISVLKKQKN
jgi:ABC-type polysaccharide/polyol phosphate export permease